MDEENNIQQINQNEKKKLNKGPYLLGEVLGEGAFAKVRLATQIHIKEKCAIKIVNKRLLEDTKDVQRLRKEIKILKTIRHKNIVQLYDIMESKMNLYFVMEYCKGGELFDYIVKKKRLLEKEACIFFQQIINGVEYLHSQGIIHRDLKPENLLLNEKNQIKISDFGLSTFFSKNNLLQTACGTPSYAPPEMLEGQQYNGEAADIWSCGIILYAMLCGNLPFAESKEEIILKKIKKQNFIIPSYLSKDAQDILYHILKINPDERFTIEKIKKHPWFNIIIPHLTNGLSINKIKIPVDDNILEMVKEAGFNKDECKELLLANKFCSLTSIYYLCLNKYVREGGKSNSDLESDLFEKYIKDKNNYIVNDNNMEVKVKENEKKNLENKNEQKVIIAKNKNIENKTIKKINKKIIRNNSNDQQKSNFKKQKKELYTVKTEKFTQNKNKIPKQCYVQDNSQITENTKTNQLSNQKQQNKYTKKQTNQKNDKLKDPKFNFLIPGKKYLDETKEKENETQYVTNQKNPLYEIDLNLLNNNGNNKNKYIAYFHKTNTFNNKNVATTTNLLYKKQEEKINTSNNITKSSTDNKIFENKEILSPKINKKEKKEKITSQNDNSLTANSRAIYQNYRNCIKEGNTEKKLNSAPIQIEMFSIDKFDDNFLLDSEKPINVINYIAKKLVSSSFCGNLNFQFGKQISALQSKQNTELPEEHCHIISNGNLLMNEDFTEEKTNVETEKERNSNNNEGDFKNLISVLNQKFKNYLYKENFKKNSRRHKKNLLLKNYENNKSSTAIFNYNDYYSDDVKSFTQKKYNNENSKLYYYNINNMTNHYNNFLEISTNYDPGIDSKGESSIEKPLSSNKNELRNYSYSLEKKVRKLKNNKKNLGSNNIIDRGNSSQKKYNKIINIISEDEELNEFNKMNKKPKNKYQFMEKKVEINLSTTNKRTVKPENKKCK